VSTTETTWDGLPIATDNPRGAGVVVRHPSGVYLLLHRHHNGPGYEGDWAWTSPSGARLPGEPVLACAERELCEETRLSGLELRPVDLSGGWAVFAATAPDTDAVAIDPEHDRFEWLPYEPAVARLAPQSVVDNFQRGATVPLPALAFRPLAYEDLPVLEGWLAEPHVAPWYDTPPDLTAKYGPRIDGTHPVRVHLLLVDDRPAGLFQCYEAPDAEAGIDYLIGDPDLVGRGIGTQAIWAYVRDTVLPAHPAAGHVVADPTPDNLRSVRALEKAGFVRRGTVYALDRARIFGP
jgi:RimJ/RimL family protein N-acetyltransferase